MQQELKWTYYNHALIPTTAPHEAVDEEALKQKGFWKSAGGHPFLARWTSNYDCPGPTEWWYVIKDQPFDFMDVGSNYRQKIRRGLKDFDIRIIEPTEYPEAMYTVEAEALAVYPAKYRPKLNHDQFVSSLKDRHKYNCITFAAFEKETDELAGYMCIIDHTSYISLYALKTRPSMEKKQLNAALVYGMLEHFNNDIAQGIYIVDGERSVLHETQFQDYLEKYFGFRKAYCRLHIRYRGGIRLIIACLYPIRGLLRALNEVKFICQINSVLKMEDIIRKQKGSCGA
ncbi:MAG TPA: hypothetical protein PKU80_00445 [Candidatus Limiplasma sp.]|nr:hypothetical protein [Candidatus Limiplasma sp.]HRX07862.1 hypothetical protein [Candidatus Limiplasma sp.]